MERTAIFKGIIPPVPTILDDSGKLDRDGMGKLIDFLID
jgi:dihydrodipicolinate synthase/N-acetylneuraminate lyase